MKRMLENQRKREEAMREKELKRQKEEEEKKKKAAEVLSNAKGNGSDPSMVIFCLFLFEQFRQNMRDLKN